MLRLLSEQVQEQRRANDLKEKEVTVLRRREANVQLLIERYADLGERVSGLADSVSELILALHGREEWYIYSAELLERLEKENLLILGSLTGKKNGEPIKLEELLGQGKARLRALINRHQRRLDKLKNRQAAAGTNSPAELLTEIEDIEAEIVKLQGRLVEL